MEALTENRGSLSIGEFLSDIRYVVTSPAQRFPVILERGVLWGSILLLVAPVYFGFSYAGGVYFDRDPFPGYSFLIPAVIAACAQLLKAYFIHFIARLLEGKGHYSAATGSFRNMLVVFGYSTAPGSLALILAAVLYFVFPGQVGAMLRDFRIITISVFIAVGLGLFIWNLILLVLALRPIYRMRDLKIVAAFLLGSVLVGVPGAATALVAAPVHIPSVYLQSIVSPRVLGFLASNPEESRGKEAKLSLHVDRIVYRFKMPERFDFVSYVSPPEQQPSEGKGTTNGETSLFSWRSVSQLAGRIVGLPEDSVELVQGRLRINGQFWAEPYIPDEFQAKVSLPLTHLGTSEYLILPDNRALLESQKEIPVVHHSRITGRILLVKWPMGWSFYRPTAFLHAYPLSSGNTPN